MITAPPPSAGPSADFVGAPEPPAPPATPFILHPITLGKDSRETTASGPGVTARVVVLCLALAVLFGYAIPVIDYKLANTFLGANHLPPGAIGVLLVLLVVLNPLLFSLRRAWRFSRNEVLTVYICCLFVCLVPGHGGEGFILFNLMAPFYKANAANGWMPMLEENLRPWLTPALQADGTYNAGVVEGWFTGLHQEPIPWGAWLVPLAFWSVFVLTSYFMFSCLAVILRRQWSENEALAFPLLRLPLELTSGMDGSGSRLPPLFYNKVMWLGFFAAVLVRLVNGLNLYFPDVPAIPLSIPAGPYLTEAPWNQIGFIKVTVIPIAVGLAFLLTSEMSFSLWFFFWAFKFSFIAAYYLGFVPGALPEQPGVVESKLFAGYQMVGCNIAYVAFVLWLGREHLRHVARRAVGRARADEAEGCEVLSYPVAFWGLLGSLALMVAATCAAGVRLDISLLLWGAYLVIAIGLARMVVEGGLLFLMYQVSPLGVLQGLFGNASWLTLGNGLVPAAFFQNGLTYHMRGFLLPSFVQSFKLAYDQGISGRGLAWLLAAVVPLSLVVGWSTVVRLGYENGGLQLGQNAFIQSVGSNSMAFVKSVTDGSGAPAWQNWLWTGVGMSLTLGMVAARSRWLWFPLHPLGYLVGLTYPIQVLWLSIMIAWSAKMMISRFVGSDGVKHATPAFLGLILGDVSMMLFWLAVDGWQGRMGHSLSNG